MKSRYFLYILLALVLVALGGIWFFTRGETRAPSQVFPAVVQRDCAPWDGSAFTISIPLQDTTIAISIYRTPDILFSTRYSFPDASMRTGNVLLLLPVGTPELLAGKIWFKSVKHGIPVEGRFQLLSETGVQYEGRFLAEWRDEIVYCG